ncbi:MAG TPA: hypothetical protein VJR71_01905 [Pseudolabrys sp.]|nr:hypothetical protein [Pseudolabrys sp.]
MKVWKRQHRALAADPNSMRLIALTGFPLVKPDDNVAAIILLIVAHRPAG